MTAKARILQADVTRLVKGFLAAGISVGGIRVAPNGEIVVFAEGCLESPSAPKCNPLDEVLLNVPQGKATR